MTNKRQYDALKLFLANARRERKMTQKDLAKVLDRPQSFVSKYETGERRLDIIELLDVCNILDVEIIKLIEKISSPKRRDAIR